ncbi:MAG TPA: NAD(P)-dependent glycerol-3-phosphate dehydrogenase [Alphaproteobacteria bacterium]|nr:NAD(P)-dependent glycerol-3-phosphate dehydrogenase [Alphaproteobacteria bacterium]
MTVLNRIGIIGTGAWGTALATACRRAGREVVLRARKADVADAINKTHENPAFLPGVALDPAIRATLDEAEAVDADAVLMVMPAQHLRQAGRSLAACWKPGVPAVICCKGIEQESCALMSEVLAETIPDAPLAVLSGPTFAAEVARDLPTGVTLAAADPALAEELSAAIGTPRFRTYQSDDVIGAQMGGAVKNVLAIACGIVEGRNLGDNTRATLITRGLSEIVHLGQAKGARMETLMGLSGLGDLILTCNAMQSRNFSLGVALGEGRSLEDIQGARNSVAEGVFSASSVSELARRLDVDMPICLAVDGVLNHFADIDATIKGLLARPFGAELRAPETRRP